MFFVKQGLCHIDCTFEKDTIHMNEKAIINCTIDNIRCDKTIKEIRVRVLRQMTCTATSESAKYLDSTYLMVSHFPGVRHGVKEVRKLEIDFSTLLDPYRRIKKIYKKKKKELKPEDIAL